MSEPGAEPNPQRRCDLCGRVDRTLRTGVFLPGGRYVDFHLPGAEECGVAGADPHPEIDEDAAVSQLREAMIQDPMSRTPAPDEVLSLPTVDCSDPANHYAPMET